MSYMLIGVRQEEEEVTAGSSVAIETWSPLESGTKTMTVASVLSKRL